MIDTGTGQASENIRMKIFTLHSYDGPSNNLETHIPYQRRLVPFASKQGEANEGFFEIRGVRKKFPIK